MACDNCTTEAKCAEEDKCLDVEAAEPIPSPDETHAEYMTRCMAMGYTSEECMVAHEGHEFKEAEKKDEDEMYAEEISVTIDLDVVEMVAVVSSESNSVAYGLEYTSLSAQALRASDPVYQRSSA